MYNFFLLSLVILFTACSHSNNRATSSQSIKDYYFPVDKLWEGKVYEYKIIAEGQEFLSHYWHLRSQKEGDKLFLIWERYNPLFQKDMSIKEWIINDGVITEEYNFHVKDSASQELKTYPNQITQNVVFPFQATTDSLMVYRFECQLKLPPDFLTIKLIRDRKLKELSSYNFKGKELPTAVFIKKDLYDIENKKEGGFWKQKKNTIEIYAKGIGLVYEEEKTEGSTDITITKLTNIYTLAEFKKLQ